MVRISALTEATSIPAVALRPAAGGPPSTPRAAPPPPPAGPAARPARARTARAAPRRRSRTRSPPRRHALCRPLSRCAGLAATAAGDFWVTLTVSVPYDAWLVSTLISPCSWSICVWASSTRCCTASVSPIVFALARMVRNWSRLALSAVSRACWSAACAVTSLPRRGRRDHRAERPRLRQDEVVRGGGHPQHDGAARACCRSRRSCCSTRSRRPRSRARSAGVSTARHLTLGDGQGQRAGVHHLGAVGRAGHGLHRVRLCPGPQPAAWRSRPLPTAGAPLSSSGTAQSARPCPKPNGHAVPRWASTPRSRAPTRAQPRRPRRPAGRPPRRGAGGRARRRTGDSPTPPPPRAPRTNEGTS